MVKTLAIAIAVGIVAFGIGRLSNSPELVANKNASDDIPPEEFEMVAGDNAAKALAILSQERRTTLRDFSKWIATIAAASIAAVGALAQANALGPLTVAITTSALVLTLLLATMSMEHQRQHLQRLEALARALHFTGKSSIEGGRRAVKARQAALLALRLATVMLFFSATALSGGMTAKAIDCTTLSGTSKPVYQWMCSNVLGFFRQ